MADHRTMPRLPVASWNEAKDEGAMAVARVLADLPELKTLKRVEKALHKRKKKRQEERALAQESAKVEKTRGDNAERLSFVVEEIDRKVWKLRHYSKYLKALQKAQVLDHFDSCNVTGGRLTLHGKQVPALTFSTPHGGSNDKRPREIPREMRKLDGYPSREY